MEDQSEFFYKKVEKLEKTKVEKTKLEKKISAVCHACGKVYLDK